MDMKYCAEQAKEASMELAAASTEQKNIALQLISEMIDMKRDAIIAANKEDLERSKNENLAKPLLKRLKFDNAKIDSVIKGIESLIELEEPVGKVLLSTELDNKLNLYKVSCPIGVIGVIFESRPDALIQISTLCLKSGNAALLKGGSEALLTNRILAAIIMDATSKAGLTRGWMSLIETRDDVKEMLAMDEYIDLIIPRGSNEFVKYIMDHSNIPVMGHADGICHVYIDSKVDIDMAVKVTLDSKVQYVAVCNATETVLIHKDVAKVILPFLKRVYEENNVEIKGCSRTCEIITCTVATDEDWATEYLDYIVSIKIVDDMEEAIKHINKYGSGHTDAIVTKEASKAETFINYVDSGNVLWNCSTRFSDGFRYGFGAEVGISTNKLHARGPVGLDGLMIYKYVIKGNGQIVEDYSNGTKTFTHKQLDSGGQFEI